MSSLSPHGRERRRFPRYPLRLPVQIELDGNRYPCLALNFCLEGMFLQPRQALETVTTPVQVVVHLALQGAGTQPLAASVVRHNSEGMGIRFHKPLPESVLTWLRKRQLPEPADSAPSSSLQDFMQQAGQQLLRETLAAFFDTVEPQLLQQAEKCQSNAEQSAFCEAAHLLKRQADTIRETTSEQFRQRAGISPETEAARQPPTSQGLSLIDQEDFEDWLNVTETAAPLESEYRNITQRLEFLQHHDNPAQDSRIPLCPTFLGECLRAALNQAGIDHLEVRKALYRHFFTVLRSPLAAKLNQVCEAFQIDPDGLPPIPPQAAEPSAAGDTPAAAAETPAADTSTAEPQRHATAKVELTRFRGHLMI